MEKEQQIAPTGVENKDLTAQEWGESFGADGTKNYDGYIQQDYNHLFSDNRSASEVYEKMRKNDAQINATLQVMYLPIRTTLWNIKPFSEDDSKDKEIAEFIEKALFEELDWDFLLSQMLLMLPFGYSVFEKVYKFEEGKFFLENLAYRRPETILKWETQEQTPGVTQILNAPIASGINKGKNQISIPAEKLVIFTHQREGNDYQGTSVLRTCYKNWLYKDNYYRFDSVKQERESLGVPVVYQPRNTDANTQTKLQEIVANLRTAKNVGVIIPGSKEDGWSFEFASPAGGDKTGMWESIKHHNREISKNILAQFIDLGSEKGGSYALSENQSSIFMLSLEAIAKNIKGIVNKYIIPELVKLNFDTEDYPTLESDKIGDVDIATVSSALSQLTTAGLLSPDFNTENYLRTVLRLPKKSEEDYIAEQEAIKEAEEQSIEKTLAKKVEVKKEEKEMKKIDKKKGFKDYDWIEFAKLFNNQSIIDIQNELSPAEREELKKKGLRFNEYEYKAWRPLTFAERKVNFSLINKTMDKYQEKLDKALSVIEKKQKTDLLKQLDKAVKNNDIKALGAIKMKYKGELSQTITDIQKEIFEVGKKTASTEMSVRVPPTKREVQGAMRVQSDAMVSKATNDIENSIITNTTREASKANGLSKVNINKASIIASKTIDDIFVKARSAYNTYAIGGAINTGRASVYERYPEKVYAVQYSAIIDERTTEMCLSLDGRVFPAGSSAAMDYEPPNHFNCRSIMVEVLQEEVFKPRIDTEKPLKSIPPTTDLNNQKKMIKPVVKKGSPAVGQIQKEITRREQLVVQYEQASKYPNRVKVHEKKIKTLKSAIKGKFIEFIKSSLNGRETT